MILKGGRKHTIVLLALASAFLLALLGKLSAEFATVVSVCVAAYMGSHMVQDYKNGRVT